MADVLQRTVAILVALILGAAGYLSLASAAVAGTPPGQVHAHGYDAAVYGESPTYAASDRGPPGTSYDDNPLTAVDRVSSRASARSDGASIDTHPSYALPAEVAQGRAPTSTTTTAVELIDRALLSMQPWLVAANGDSWLAGRLAMRNEVGAVRLPGGPLSPNQLNQAILRGKAPAGLRRVDTGKVPGEQTHIHFDDGSALNMDGTWKHGGTTLTNAQAKWLKANGWVIPRE